MNDAESKKTCSWKAEICWWGGSGDCNPGWRMKISSWRKAKLAGQEIRTELAAEKSKATLEVEKLRLDMDAKSLLSLKVEDFVATTFCGLQRKLGRYLLLRRYANVANWNKQTWIFYLSALLTRQSIRSLQLNTIRRFLHSGYSLVVPIITCP